MVDHVQDPELDEFDSDALGIEDDLHRISEDIVEAYAENLEKGHNSDTAARLTGFSCEGIRQYLLSHPALLGRVDRARALWMEHHLGTLKNPGTSKGASAKVRAALGALASVDQRFRKPRPMVGGNINVNLQLPDMRPATVLQGEVGDPAAYSLPGNGQAALEAPAETIDAVLEPSQPQGLVASIIEGCKSAKKAGTRSRARAKRAPRKKGTKAKRKVKRRAPASSGPAPIL